ncbi:hypothetical protein Bealeia2_02053 (plasmid) [Candidatus Bealeia paramacronuclearis]|uniref:hypothetical protein n=1 Tax=Candidatus Bealeia paramacronuclearis TaxID=1921001 RepID=UPI002C15AE0B|nr:hypothetical protein [Candidatus Bealeia paramacronuclearis]
MKKSFGIELEFPELIFRPFCDNRNLEKKVVFDILSYDTKTFHVTIDNYTLNKSGIMEIVSEPYFGKVPDHLFDPVSKFLEFLFIKLKGNKPMLLDSINTQSWKYGKYFFDYKMDKPIYIQKVGNVSFDQLTPSPQATFGFGSVSFLEQFFYFCVTGNFEDVCWIKPFDEKANLFHQGLEPFGTSTESILLTKTKIKNRGVYCIIEFLKWYIASSFDGSTQILGGNSAQKNINHFGNKLCQDLLLRTSFKNMYHLIPHETRLTINSKHAGITKYIKECLKNPDSQIYPVYKNNMTLGSPAFQYINNNPIKKEYRDCLTIDNIVQSIFNNIDFAKQSNISDEYLSLNLLNKNYSRGLMNRTVSYTESCTPALDKLLSSFQNKIYIEMKDNKDWSDYIADATSLCLNSVVFDSFSPLPLQPLDDPMGLYSRPPISITDQIIIENRKFSNTTMTQGAKIEKAFEKYSEAFKKFIESEENEKKSTKEQIKQVHRKLSS